MQVLKTRDVEDALRIDLKALLAQFGYDVIAPPIPDSLGKDLPLVVVNRLGGGRSEIVVEEHDVSIDIYDERWSLAQDDANTIVALAASLADSQELASGVDWLNVEITTLPYNNPDPYHSDIPRVTFAAMVSCRPVAIEI